MVRLVVRAQHIRRPAAVIRHHQSGLGDLADSGGFRRGGAELVPPVALGRFDHLVDDRSRGIRLRGYGAADKQGEVVDRHVAHDDRHGVRLRDNRLLQYLRIGSVIGGDREFLDLGVQVGADGVAEIPLAGGVSGRVELIQEQPARADHHIVVMDLRGCGHLESPRFFPPTGSK